MSLPDENEPHHFKASPSGDGECGWCGRKARATIHPVGQDWPEDMCENCVTPWKCNGPHISDSGERIEERPSS